jgi:WD40 repeat protein
MEDFGYFYIGSCFAALGEVEESIPYLKKAFGSSLTAKAAIDQDPDLVLIKELTSYESVLEDFDRLTMEVQGGHSSAILGVDFSPDDRIVYTAGQDHTLRMWLPDGRLVKTLEAHTFAVNSVDVSPDGELLATAGGDGSVKLWTADGGLQKKLLAHTDEVKSAVISPDGSRIVSGGWDKRIILWDILGRVLKFMDGESYINDLCYSPDGSRIVSGHHDGSIRIWSAEGELLQTLNAHAGAP